MLIRMAAPSTVGHRCYPLLKPLQFLLQLQYCLIDQLLHGPDPPTGQRAEREVGELMRRHSALGGGGGGGAGWGAQGGHPHIRFTHLVGYGATYYSYLYAQCLAARIWQARRRTAAQPCTGCVAWHGMALLPVLRGHVLLLRVSSASPCLACLPPELQEHLALDPLGGGAGSLLRRRLLEPGGALEARSMVEGLLAPGGVAPGGSRTHGGGHLVAAAGGWFPDPAALIDLSCEH